MSERFNDNEPISREVYDGLRAEELPEFTSSIRALVQLAREDFVAFFTLFSFVNCNKVGRLQKHLCAIVQDVSDGFRGRRQSISLPPQHGKSEVFCRVAPAWIMGRHPGAQLGVAGFDHELVLEFSDWVRGYCEHPWYQAVFGEDVMVDTRSMARKANWGLTNGSRIRARSVGKKFTGRKLDWVFIDDAHAGREEAESETQRRKVQTWYFGDVYSRLAPKSNIFIIGTRWHPDDLIGHLTSDEYRRDVQLRGDTGELYEVTNLPALAEPTPEKPDQLGRKEGEALAPELGRGNKFLDEVRSVQPSYEWRSQYQGDPMPASSGQVDIKCIHRIDAHQLPPSGTLEFVRGWDLAVTDKTSADWTVGVLCAYHKETDTFYLLDVFRKKLSWPKLKPKMIQIARAEALDPAMPVLRIGMEAVSGFNIGFFEVRDALRGRVRVERRNPAKRGGKFLRAQKWMNMVEGGKFYMVNAPWNKVFLEELMIFPAGKHDDQIDAISVAYECLCQNFKIHFA